MTPVVLRLAPEMSPQQFKELCERVKQGYNPTLADYTECSEVQNLTLVAVEHKRMKAKQKMPLTSICGDGSPWAAPYRK